MYRKLTTVEELRRGSEPGSKQELGARELESQRPSMKSL